MKGEGAANFEFQTGANCCMVLSNAQRLTLYLFRQGCFAAWLDLAADEDWGFHCTISRWHQKNFCFASKFREYFTVRGHRRGV